MVWTSKHRWAARPSGQPHLPSPLWRVLVIPQICHIFLKDTAGGRWGLHDTIHRKKSCLDICPSPQSFPLTAVAKNLSSHCPPCCIIHSPARQPLLLQHPCLWWESLPATPIPWGRAAHLEFLSAHLARRLPLDLNEWHSPPYYMHTRARLPPRLGSWRDKDHSPS